MSEISSTMPKKGKKGGRRGDDFEDEEPPKASVANLEDEDEGKRPAGAAKGKKGNSFLLFSSPPYFS